ncbi:MAG: endoribonuclease YicC domain-containing protein [Bacteroidia bacterium]
MLYGMTGYGQARGEGLTLILRSLNGKNLELQFHAPARWFEMENYTRQQLQTLGRGSIRCYVFEEAPTQNWLHALDAWEKAFFPKEHAPASLTDKVLARGFILLSNVIAPQPLSTQEKNLFEKLLHLALSQLQAQRKAEGESIQKALLDALAHLHELVSHLPDLLSERYKALEEKLQTLAQALQAPQERAWQEIGWHLEKIDIQEEAQRLGMHLKAFEDVLFQDENTFLKGRLLDHLAQEMQREAQTLAAKAQYAPLQHITTHLRAYIEAMRQQLANVV